MTAAVATPGTRPDTHAAPCCQSCGGPCWQWRGSVWEFTCSACLASYLDAAAARADARQLRERERLMRKLFREESGRLRGGGGPSYVPRHRLDAGPREQVAHTEGTPL